MKHRTFVDEMDTPAYGAFWEALRKGNARSGEFKRVGKNGKVIYLQATYTPIVFAGQVVKVVKFATDITAEKLRSANFEAQLTAISKSQAVVEFDLDGTILSCNEIFAATMGFANKNEV